MYLIDMKVMTYLDFRGGGVGITGISLRGQVLPKSKNRGGKRKFQGVCHYNSTGFAEIFEQLYLHCFWPKSGTNSHKPVVS